MSSVAAAAPPATQERHLGTDSRSGSERCARRLDVEAALARPPGHLRRLCELLKDVPAAQAARHMGITRSTLRRHLRHVRDLFVTSGVTTDFSAPFRDPIP